MKNVFFHRGKILGAKARSWFEKNRRHNRNRVTARKLHQPRRRFLHPGKQPRAVLGILQGIGAERDHTVGRLRNDRFQHGKFLCGEALERIDHDGCPGKKRMSGKLLLQPRQIVKRIEKAFLHERFIFGQHHPGFLYFGSERALRHQRCGCQQLHRFHSAQLALLHQMQHQRNKFAVLNLSPVKLQRIGRSAERLTHQQHPSAFSQAPARHSAIFALNPIRKPRKAEHLHRKAFGAELVLQRFFAFKRILLRNQKKKRFFPVGGFLFQQPAGIFCLAAAGSSENQMQHVFPPVFATSFSFSHGWSCFGNSNFRFFDFITADVPKSGHFIL